MVKRLGLSLLLELFITVLATYAVAMPNDQKQVAQVRADAADLNQQQHTGSYIGNVQFDQGTTHLRAAKAVTIGDKNNKLTCAEAVGNAQTPAHYWTQTVADKPLVHAYAEIIRYYPLRHLIELIGHARIQQGTDSFLAPKITYDTVKQRISSQSDGKTRTTIIIHPGKRS